MFESGVVGKAPVGKMCAYLSSGGLNSVSSRNLFFHLNNFLCRTSVVKIVSRSREALPSTDRMLSGSAHLLTQGV
jgi:hypothetical protein